MRRSKRVRSTERKQSGNGNKNGDETASSRPTRIQKHGPDSNFLVCLNEHRLLTNKFVLRYSSPVWSTMLDGDPECTEIDCSVDLGSHHGAEVTFETWAAFLRCLYPMPDPSILTRENFVGVAALALKYDIEKLRAKCDEFGKNLMEDKFIEVDVELLKTLNACARIRLNKTLEKGILLVSPGMRKHSSVVVMGLASALAAGLSANKRKDEGSEDGKKEEKDDGDEEEEEDEEEEKAKKIEFCPAFVRSLTLELLREMEILSHYELTPLRRCIVINPRCALANQSFAAKRYLAPKGWNVIENYQSVRNCTGVVLQTYERVDSLTTYAVRRVSITSSASRSALPTTYTYISQQCISTLISLLFIACDLIRAIDKNLLVS